MQHPGLRCSDETVVLEAVAMWAASDADEGRALLEDGSSPGAHPIHTVPLSLQLVSFFKCFFDLERYKGLASRLLGIIQVSALLEDGSSPGAHLIHTVPLSLQLVSFSSISLHSDLSDALIILYLTIFIFK